MMKAVNQQLARASISGYRQATGAPAARGTERVHSAGTIRRGFVVVPLAVLFMFSGVFFPADAAAKEGVQLAPLEGARPAQWRVIWTDDPAHRATVSWNTAAPGKEHRVHFKAAEAGEWTVVECDRNGRFTGREDSPVLYYHHCRLTGLKPATKYSLVMESDGTKSPEFYFVTAPDDDRTVRLLFGGDSRSDRPMRQKMNQMLSGLLADQPSIVALAHGGDYIVNGYNLAQWSAWMSDHELTATADGRLLPIVPTRGNHDFGPIFNEIFGFPQDDENYYGFNLAGDVRLLTLNTEVSTAGEQALWLEDELAHWRPKCEWLLAQYHRPAFPAIKMPSSAKRDWVPLFEKFNVDVVLEADGHNIKRTPPIRDGQVDSTGVVYLGEGGLGVKQRTPLSKRWFLQPPGFSSMGHHVQLLTFEKDRLTAQVIRYGGEVADESVIVPHERRQALAHAASARKPVALEQ